MRLASGDGDIFHCPPAQQGAAHHLYAYCSFEDRCACDCVYARQHASNQPPENSATGLN